MNQIELITRDGSLLHVRAHRGLADLLSTGSRTGNVGVFDVDRQRWSWLTLADVALVAS
jgi:predicted ATP-grasp superfamily ATP-dependent carboligase